MKTLLIDNYDSFTFNLAHLLAKANGEWPEIVRNDEARWEELETADFDNIVISPGPGRPEVTRDFGVSADAIRFAQVPLLGVCLGHQGIAHLFGGRVAHAPEPVHGKESQIIHRGQGIFAGLPSPFSVVRYHSLIVVEKELPADLQADAWTEDGLLMALSHRSRPIYGVQFHPESILSEWGQELIANFHRITREWNERSSKHRSSHSVYFRREPDSLNLFDPSQGQQAFTPKIRRLESYPCTEALLEAELAQSRYAFWLDSACKEPGVRSRFSYLGGFASEPEQIGGHVLRYSIETGDLTIEHDHERVEIRRQSVLDYLAHELKNAQVRAPEVDVPFDFLGGYVGYFGYEMGWECLGITPPRTAGTDSAWLFVDRLVVIDHVERCCYVVALEREDGATEAAGEWLARMSERIQQLCEAPVLPRGLRVRLDAGPAGALPGRESVRFRARSSRDEYLRQIRHCLDWIRDGESYELCLTQAFKTDAHPDPLALYRGLRSLNPAPFAAFLRLPGATVLSSSPERFLRIDRKGRIEAKPIKGTAPRSVDAIEDESRKRALATSPKDRAENLMIVDLLRNDLGSVAEIGSVEVPRLMDIESYASVHQMVSTVTAQLRPEVGAIDAIRAAFPGGSMTGAPKRRSMELLDQLEQSPRGVYSGAVGFLGLNGAADLSIVIRTIVMPDEGGLSIGAGGAVVYDSDPKAELDEMAWKARLPMSAVALAVTGDADGFEIEWSAPHVSETSAPLPAGLFAAPAL